MSTDKNEQNEYDVVKCEQPFFTKEDALTKGAQQLAYHDKLTQLELVEEWLPVPSELKFLQQVYLYVIYQACVFIAKEKYPGCKSQLPLSDAQHKVTSVGCEATNNDVVKNYFDVAKPLVTDKIMKDVFLASWKNLNSH